MNIMIVDDDIIISEINKKILKDYQTLTFLSPLDALEELKHRHYDILIVDYKMPEMNGIDFMVEAKKINKDFFTILLTGYPEKVIIENSFNHSLVDLILTKPVEKNLLLSKIASAKDSIQNKPHFDEFSRFEQYQLKSFGNSHDCQYQKIIGLSKTLEEINPFFSFPIHILIAGEQGTGKDLMAHHIHRTSSRKDRVFYKIDLSCPNDIEMTHFLFNSDSVASYKNQLVFSTLKGGTLYLDHIEKADPILQDKLLGIIEYLDQMSENDPEWTEKRFRLICSTSVNLNNAIEEKTFRSDLYYRISRFTLFIPPLRERKDDIPQLLEYMIAKFADLNQIAAPVLSKPLTDKLSGYNWPGNVAELELAINRALLHYKINGKLDENCFEIPFKKRHNEELFRAYDLLSDEIISQKLDFKKIEKEIINLLINKFDGDIIKASKETGIFRDKFYRNRYSK